MTVLDRKACEEQEEEVLPYHDAMRRKGSRSSVSWIYSGCRKICPIYIKCVDITALFCVQIRYLKKSNNQNSILPSIIFQRHPHVSFSTPYPSFLSSIYFHSPSLTLPSLVPVIHSFLFLMLDSSYIEEWSREDQRAQTLGTDNSLPHMTPCPWTIKLPSVPLSPSLNGGENSHTNR